MTKDKAKRLFLTAIILLTVAQGLSSSVFSNYFKEVYQVDSVQRGFLEIPREMPGVLCVVVISLLGSMGNVSMAFIAYGLSCLGLLVLGLLSPSYGMMMVFLFICSLGEHMMMPLRDSIAIDLSQEGKTGTFLGKLKWTHAFFIDDDVAGRVYRFSCRPFLVWGRRDSFILSGAGYHGRGCRVYLETEKGMSGTECAAAS